MSKNLMEVPMLNSVAADYSTNVVAADYSIPRRVTGFGEEFKTFSTYQEDVFKQLSEDTAKDKVIKRLKAENKELRKLLANQGESTVSRRLVKVIIVDPNENLRLEDAVLVNEAEKLTDLEDNEIFFDMDIKGVLSAHNRKRTEVVDKKASKNKDKDVFLEPIKIRDLKMSVITIATF